jgi:glyoxylase-like metal-dependent hydrolase (beta-lactamase superfamily II)
MRRLIVGCCLLGFTLVPSAHAEPPLRLYALDCGRATLDDAAAASDTGEYEHKPLVLADPCFVIQHPLGVLLWDAGLPPDLPSGPGFRVQPAESLVEQLHALGLTPDDVKLVAFSHLHFDHVGNAGLFPHATFILSRTELAWAEAEPSNVSMDKTLLRVLRSAQPRWIDGDHDVFGDGTVRIFHAPGHTPGSAVLWLDLPEHGPVILSGDLYVTRDSRAHRYVPTVNSDRADTLASMARIERLARRTHAQIVVQHDTRDFAALPRPPAYWR